MHTLVGKIEPFIFFFILCNSTEIYSPANDANKYEFHQLENGIKTFLVEDKNSSECSISVNIHTGYADDPLIFQGLAHALEKIVANGFIEATNSTSLMMFALKNGGTFVSKTTDTETFFTVSSNYQVYSKIIVYFFYFFTERRLDPVVIKAALDQLHKKYTTNLFNSRSNVDQLLRHLSNPSSAYHRFGDGNYHYLKEGNFQQALKDFLEKNYVGQKMSIALKCTSFSILKEMAQLFSKINAGSPPNLIELLKEPFFAPQNLNKVVFYHSPTIKKTNLTLFFVLPYTLITPNFKALDFVLHLTACEQPGRLVWQLREKNYIDDINIYYDYFPEAQAFFYINMILTPWGAENFKNIVEMALKHLEALASEINPSYIQEIQTAAHYRFNFGFSDSYKLVVKQLLEGLLLYPPLEALRGPFKYEQFNARYFTDALSHFKRQNLIVLLSTQNIRSQYNEEPVYRTRYLVENLGTFRFTSFSALHRYSSVSIEMNPFLPPLQAYLSSPARKVRSTNIDAVMRSQIAMNYGALGMIKTTQISLNQVTDAQCTFLITLPHINKENVNKNFLLPLWISILNEYMNGLRQKVELINGTIKLETASSGFAVDAKAPYILMEKLLDVFAEQFQEFNQERYLYARFSLHHKRIMDELLVLQQSVSLRKESLLYLWDIRDHLDLQEIYRKAYRLTFKDFAYFSANLLQQIYIEGVCTGELSTEITSRAFTKIATILKGTALERSIENLEKNFFPNKRIIILAQNIQNSPHGDGYELVCAIPQSPDAAGFSYLFKKVAEKFLLEFNTPTYIKLGVTAETTQYSVIFSAINPQKTALELREECIKALNYIMHRVVEVEPAYFEKLKTQVSYFYKLILENNQEVHRLLRESIYHRITLFDHSAAIIKSLSYITLTSFQNNITTYFLQRTSSVEVISVTSDTYKYTWDRIINLQKHEQTLVPVFLWEQLKQLGTLK